MSILSFAVGRPSDRHICWCCRRADCGLGMPLTHTRPMRVVWACEDHIKMTRKAASLMPKEFDRCERKAAQLAGMAGGEYLMQISKTDLGSISPEEYDQYVTTIISAFGPALKEIIDSYEAPF